MSKLKVELKKKEYPYEDDPSASFNLWGEIIICYEDEILLDTQWNITNFIEWFIENEEYLKIEKFPFEYTNSIAESRDLLFERVDDFSDSQEQEMFDYVDELSEYFPNHYFHLRGTDTQSYYIGLTPTNGGEISYCVDDKYYSYNFDMDKFITRVDEEIKRFLESTQIKASTQSFFEEALPSYYSYIGSII